jgi:hypothetical protein
MLSGSFSIFVLSNPFTFCQTQTGATVPLSKTWILWLTAIMSSFPYALFRKFMYVLVYTVRINETSQLDYIYLHEYGILSMQPNIWFYLLQYGILLRNYTPGL